VNTVANEFLAVKRVRRGSIVYTQCSVDIGIFKLITLNRFVHGKVSLEVSGSLLKRG
jgi:hypothetical protein